MKARLVALALVVLGGGVAWGQWCPPPGWCPPPPPPEPPCYTTFWVGEPIQIELVVPWGIFCCNPCAGATLITGWTVEAFGGGLVYSYTFPYPVGADTKLVWDQKDQAGAQVGPGFYKITVLTTGKPASIHVKIEERTASWCFSKPIAKPCGFSFCDPYLKLSRAPACDPCAWSVCGTGCDPCCWPLLPFLFFLGIGK